MNDVDLSEPPCDEGAGEDGVWIMGSPWAWKATVHADPGTEGREVDFWIECDLKGSPKDPKDQELVFDKTQQKMKKKDWFEIEFGLDDKSGLKLEFAPNPMLAFWVNMGSPFNPDPACPLVPSYSPDVYATCVSRDQLRVRNEDEVIATFRFSLGFLKGGQDPKNQTSYVRYDPIGSNKNGGFR